LMLHGNPEKCAGETELGIHHLGIKIFARTLSESPEKKVNEMYSK